MKNNSTITVITYIVLFIFLTNSCNKKDNLPLNVIPLANTVGRYDILNLSDFATEIKYIPLETNDSTLIGTIGQIRCENGKILVLHSNACHLFDISGKIYRKLGQLGQGPDDYLHLLNVGMHENFIFIHDSHKLLIYNTNGDLVENIKLRTEVNPVFTEHGSFRIIPLKKDTFIMDVVSMIGTYPNAILFETNHSVLKLIKEYPNYVKIDKLRGGIHGIEMGILYRYKDEIRLYKGINDTIFTIGQNLEMKGAFVFESGKYRIPLSFIERKEGEWQSDYRKKFIWPRPVCESLNHLFISFDFGNHAPEPFEFISRSGFTVINDDVCSVFEKRTGALTLMRQPIKGKLGFKNDIDGGPVIWPKYISSENELVTYIQPEEFMEYYNKIDNPSAALKEIAENISPFDNPIVIVAKLK